MLPAHRALIDEANTHFSAGRYHDAYWVLTSQPAQSSPDALFTLAHWRLSGQVVRRDLTAARQYFRRAGEAGHKDAAHIYCAFLANGAGAKPDWQAAIAMLEKLDDDEARQELDLIGQMTLSASGDPLNLPPATPLSEQPEASFATGLFTPSECAYLSARAEPCLSPSVVIDPRTGAQVRNPIRTSDAMAFPFTDESPAIHALNRRIAAVTGTHVAAGEPLQVLRYRPGQEYRPHSDAVPGDDNQRILTVLIYLNSSYEGGETEFVQTGLKYRGEPGDALIFRNADSSGRADPMAQHAGRPVTSGEKLLSTRWIRQKRFAVDPPRPILNI